MERNMFKKGLVVGIIFLFIGVGVQPAFAKNTIKTTISETLEDCECQTVSNHNFDRLEKFEEISNRITILKEINEKSNLYNPTVCLALKLMVISEMGIGLFYHELSFAFELAGFEGIAEMFYQIGLKFYEMAGYIAGIMDDLGCPPPFPWYDS